MNTNPAAEQAPLAPDSTLPHMAARNTATFLRIAVVGHTNTGKTSLLRTLLRDPEFGVVQDQPGTTRQVEGARLLVDGEVVLELFDTPGMEDGVALMDYLDTLSRPGERIDGPDRIRRFLDSPESQRRFEQEARVLRKLLVCDAALYVIDVRDPVLGKHRDELQALAMCGHPLLPILNFVRNPNTRTQQWREALSRLNLHTSIEFDTVAPALDGETQLYEKLALMLDHHAPALHALKDDVMRQRTLRRHDASQLIADLLIDATAWRISCEPDDASIASAGDTLRQAMREREQLCVRALLRRYQFSLRDFPHTQLPLQGERWGMDLFHPQALKDMGLTLGKGMAAGAMAGATMDLFTAGLSLGAATLIGAAAGGLWQGAERWGKRIAGKLQGHRELSVDDAVIRLLAARQLALVQALEQRGHAAQGPIRLTNQPNTSPDEKHDDPGNDAMHADALLPKELRKGALPEALQAARSLPTWSSMSDAYSPDSRREQAMRSLAVLLQPAIKA